MSKVNKIVWEGKDFEILSYDKGSKKYRAEHKDGTVIEVHKDNCEKYGLYTYEYIDGGINIRFSDKGDMLCDTFDTVDDIIKQLTEEGETEFHLHLDFENIP